MSTTCVVGKMSIIVLGTESRIWDEVGISTGVLLIGVSMSIDESMSIVGNIVESSGLTPIVAVG